MFGSTVKYSGGLQQERRVSPGSPAVVDAAEEFRRHFNHNYPIMLDGALSVGDEQDHLIRQARESLARGRVSPDLLPAAILRETLDGIVAGPKAATKAGLTAVGPKNARVWWDETVLDNLDDVLARLDRPRPLLRFYDVTGLDPESGRWHEIFDIDVALDEKGRTVQIVNSDRTYVVDLGYGYADGRFLRLARTNTAQLPREGKGATGGERTVRSNLRPRAGRVDAVLAPDILAREWAEAGRDHADRDIEAELMVHMLYRAFLREGPRALRRSPRLARRDTDILHREYAQRTRVRTRRPARVKKADPGFLVVRLDARRKDAAPAAVCHYPVPLAAAERDCLRLRAGVSDARFSWQEALLSAIRGGRGLEIPGRAKPLAETAPSNTFEPIPVPATVRDTVELVTAVPVDVDTPLFMASPVFEAARTLRDSLAGMTPLATDLSEVLTDDDHEKKTASQRMFGGSEAKRMAKAGVRITRMALTLEGRMRPGARLKVAGKLVHADADGRFRLECVLTGRKASIPMRAGASVGGEARSLINVEWEKRAGREKKKAQTAL